ncbi:hypothetical protein RGQ13_02280 [Thalassotalea psychrophila]|uniref:Sel1 repeat family protein n=1 Tax=Thalassotalea psychrophila TaxID=3065647 RepID=A0ABY9TVF3_9GAMM|nr:hypothetical protein RGQ13_02280 [Colwelliaceae bacterium SQ149]
MKKIISIRNVVLSTIISLAGVMYCLPANAATSLQADGLLYHKKYQAAFDIYMEAAKIGDAEAQYQLGVIHLKGLGQSINNFKAIIWFSLAAEHKHKNAQQIYDQLLNDISAKDKALVLSSISQFQQRFGLASIKEKHFPKLITDHVNEVIRYGEQQLIYPQSSLSDITYSFSDISTDTDAELGYNDDFGDDEFGDDDFGDDPAIASLGNKLQEASISSLVADFDIAQDGSLRHGEVKRAIGDERFAMYNLHTNPMPSPEFNQQPSHFIHRAYQGISTYDRKRVRQEFPYIYQMARLQVRRLKNSDQAGHQYKLALLYMYFPWLEAEDEQINKLLTLAAKGGQVNAQYELGLKLYREQTDIRQATYWLSKAASRGLMQAEYRLGQLLLSSPWIEKDENKALLWLEKSAQQNHIAAIKKAAELRLLAENKELHNFEQAMKLLAQIEGEELQPDYLYLRAVAHKDSPTDRRLDLAVKNIRQAIALGNDYGWDVSGWKKDLANWTRTSVTITDID